MVNIYVGNLSYEASEEEVRAAFEQHGEVSSVKVIKDRETGRSRGFAFVEMPDDAEGHAAIENMNGAEVNGRPLKVTEARPREDRGPRGGGGRRF
ncbi:RNA-binding protein [candidate division GN15 bacterium]|nr:RNA-binding protein [candidate division GN15 bacterium]